VKKSRIQNNINISQTLLQGLKKSSLNGGLRKADSKLQLKKTIMKKIKLILKI